MKRLFYDQNTGEIELSIDRHVAPELDKPYIDTDNVSIRICDWIVVDGELKPNPNPPRHGRR